MNNGIPTLYDLEDLDEFLNILYAEFLYKIQQDTPGYYEILYKFIALVNSVNYHASRDYEKDIG